MDFTEKIKLFIEGKLSAEDSTAFELEIKGDAVLREEVDDYRKIFSGLEGLRQEKFKNQLREWDKELPEFKEPKKRSFWLNSNIRKIAAAALVVIVSGVIYFMMPSENNLGQFLADNYEEPYIRKFRSAEKSETVFENIKDAFENAEYGTCVSLAQNFPEKDSFYLDVKYLEGHAYYLQTKYDVATQVFNTINKIDNRVSIYKRNVFDKDNVQWTIILCRLQEYSGKPDDRMRAAIIAEVNEFLATNPGRSYKLKCKKLLDLLD